MLAHTHLAGLVALQLSGKMCVCVCVCVWVCVCRFCSHFSVKGENISAGAERNGQLGFCFLSCFVLVPFLWLV